MKSYSRHSMMCVTVSDGLFPMVLLGVCFFVGAGVGLFVCLLTPENTALAEHLLSYIEGVAAEGRVSVSLLSTVWDLTKWSLAALVLGMTRFSIVAIPVLLAVRGFLLAHAVTVFSSLFGLDGWFISLVAFGVTALIMVPVLFCVCFDRFSSALEHKIGKGDSLLMSQGSAVVLLVCLCGTLVAATLQHAVMPFIMPLVCKRLLF